MKTFKLTKEQKAKRLQNSICPGCGEHLLIKHHRVWTTIDESTGEERPHYAGWYYGCSGEHAHKCYSLSADGLSETFGDRATGTNIHPPVMSSEKKQQPTVVRREKKQK